MDKVRATTMTDLSRHVPPRCSAVLRKWAHTTATRRVNPPPRPTFRVGRARGAGASSQDHAPRALAWDDEAPGALWRVVEGTLVFADISGFTALTEKLTQRGRIGAEEIVETLNGVFGPMPRIAEARRRGSCSSSGATHCCSYSGRTATQSRPVMPRWRCAARYGLPQHRGRRPRGRTGRRPWRLVGCRCRCPWGSTPATSTCSWSVRRPFGPVRRTTLARDHRQLPAYPPSRALGSSATRVDPVEPGRRTYRRHSGPAQRGGAHHLGTDRDRTFPRPRSRPSPRRDVRAGRVLRTPTRRAVRPALSEIDGTAPESRFVRRGKSDPGAGAATTTSSARPVAGSTSAACSKAPSQRPAVAGCRSPRQLDGRWQTMDNGKPKSETRSGLTISTMTWSSAASTETP